MNYELVSLTGKLMGEAAPRPLITLCGLDSSQSMPHNPSWNLATDFALGQSALPACLLALEFLGHTSSMCSCQLSCQMGLGTMLCSMSGYVSDFCLGRAVRAHFKLLPIFPKQVFWLGRVESHDPQQVRL